MSSNDVRTRVLCTNKMTERYQISYLQETATALSRIGSRRIQRMLGKQTEIVADADGQILAKRTRRDTTKVDELRKNQRHKWKDNTEVRNLAEHSLTKTHQIERQDRQNRQIIR
jgi:hypothetical protein